eukprot:EC122972.1.p1 GENE.EC122972.1~~EC122972.1.p1  ORF type:complete len:125 (+),score=21.58 EC122972.1:144-518(+)
MLESSVKCVVAVVVLLSVTSFARANEGFDFSSLFQGLQFALHGKYCGPGHGDPNYDVEPIDDLDALCKIHDECYDKSRGGFYLDCGCDMRFINGINELQSRLSPEQQQTASLMTMYFSGSQCSC